MIRTPLVLSLVLLAGCLSPDPVEPGPGGPEPFDGVRFLAVGDVGTGDGAQHRVAAAMESACLLRGCDLVLLLGDNIYNSGASGPDDPQFQSKFEEPYAALDVPFYPVLGNHDYGGEGTGIELQKGQHQVDYSDRSDRWTMPAPYHSFQVGPVRFFALDSGPVTVHGSPAEVAGDAVAAQRAWLEDAVADSAATWNVTFAHHPYRSNGAHGDAGSYDGVPGEGAAWGGLLESVCADVDLHLAGHDHDMQWLEPTAACPDMELVVSGAGSQPRGDGGGDNPARFERFGTLGFVWVEATDDRLTLAFYDADAQLLHEGSIEA